MTTVMSGLSRGPACAFACPALAAVFLLGCGGSESAVTLAVRPAGGTVRAGGLGLTATGGGGGWVMELDRGGRAALEVRLRLDERLAALRPGRRLAVQVGIGSLTASAGGPEVRVYQLLGAAQAVAGVAGRSVRRLHTRSPVAGADGPGEIVLLLEASASPDVASGTWRYLISFAGPDVCGPPLELELTVRVR